MRVSTLGGIDCDVHPAVPGMAALLPYLDDYWREQVTIRGIGGLELVCFPPGAAAHGRADWRPADGGRPGAGLAALRAQVLDAFGSQVAILNCLSGIEALGNEHLAAALARALNDWIAAEWLDREPRLRASIVIPTQNPELAVAEIERRAGDPRFVQVMVLAMGELPLGKRLLWPIWAAAERHGLPLAIHAGSTARHASTGNGWPSYHLEDYVAASLAFQAQLLSLVSEGVFQKFPGLSVVLLESGFTWLPAFLWRANKTWRALRAEVPWVDRPPADIIRAHVRVTLQPADAPPEPRDLAHVLEQLGGDQMLLFSTDYPHWQFEAKCAFPPGFPAALRRRVLLDNPRATYPRLLPPLREDVRQAELTQAETTA
jgi:predicted TIM-barrel fold metal-dependent hydrolase